MANSDEEHGGHWRDKIPHERGDCDNSRERNAHQRNHSKHRGRERSLERDRKEHRRREKGQRQREKGHHHYDRGHQALERGHSHHEKSKRFTPPTQDIPLPKRMRRDWTDSGGGDCYRGGDFRAKQDLRGTSHPAPHPWFPTETPPRPLSHRPCMPSRFVGTPDAVSVSGHFPAALRSFKDFLMSLEPTVGEMEAVRCYSDYKVSLSKQQIEAFFLSHRDEEWFRLRYHPKEVERWDAETHNALQKRQSIFMHLLGKGWFDNVSLDTEQTPAIIKILDAVRIMFEGGTENDLQVLEVPPQTQGRPTRTEDKKTSSKAQEEGEMPAKTEVEEETHPKAHEEEEMASKTEEEERRKGKEKLPSVEIQILTLKQDDGQAIGPEHRLRAQTPRVESPADLEMAESEPPRAGSSQAKAESALWDATDPLRLTRKRKHVDEQEVSESGSTSDVPPSDQSAERAARGKRGEEDMSREDMVNQEDKEEKRIGMQKGREEEKDDKGEMDDCGKIEVVQKRKGLWKGEKRGENRAEANRGGKDEKRKDESREKGEERREEEEEKQKEKSEWANQLPPRRLHKTQSLFLRSIPPTICKEEIVNLCVKYPGFLRVCLSEPHAEHRFFRRCWVTFDHLTNIQNICLELQHARLHEFKLRPVVHRELCRRVRMANGITQHRTLLQDHIRLSAKIIHSLDHRWTLWGQDQNQENPVLRNVSHHLIEEVSAEEEELTGHVGGASPQSEVAMERDDKLVKVLDRLLLYLRIVHSVDFYGACHHLCESQMPSCCSTIHVRGPLPNNRVPAQQILEWQRKFEGKLSRLLCARETLCEEEAKRMGCKQPEQEVDKFLRANIRELDREKWQCVLCEKKFKGPDFVRKHILVRHGDKEEEVRNEAIFFNNFLMDPKRPAFPVVKSPPPVLSQPEHVVGGPGPSFSPQCVGGFSQPSPPFIDYEGGPFPLNDYGGDGGHFGWGRGRPERMPQCKRPRKFRYRDLDAPEDDFF